MVVWNSSQNFYNVFLTTYTYYLKWQRNEDKEGQIKCPVQHMTIAACRSMIVHKGSLHHRLLLFSSPLASDLSFSRKHTFVLESYTTKVNWIMNWALLLVISNGRLVKTWCAHQKSVTCLTFSSDDSFLISGSEDDMIIIWPMIGYGTLLLEDFYKLELFHYQLLQ
ncbi:Protein ROOT INITIATION DEFECTIVE 3 [Camellia lanceoleosa]|uniref:Protein ROOT INITIATION DEFECTIVE 3 n=1 Tax=Camellia lanceoleosa TaxID=1840588 RepID=A0ACC0GAM7_9ERIC|nr:Protein ROOT INITIATION DEFECTIVE 3 [Camellia lanceoleosa]